MSYFNRSSAPSVYSDAVGAAALRGTGLTVATPATPDPAPVRRSTQAGEAKAPTPVDPAENPSSVAHVEVDDQVATLQAAAAEGTPFCEECAKAASSSSSGESSSGESSSGESSSGESESEAA